MEPSSVPRKATRPRCRARSAGSAGAVRMRATAQFAVPTAAAGAAYVMRDHLPETRQLPGVHVRRSRRHVAQEPEAP